MMLFFESLRMAASNLWGHKMRSILTILGVIIGVGSVLAVVTLGASFEHSITSQFDSVDAKTIFVTASVSEPGRGPPDCAQSCNVFTEVDRTNIAALHGVEQVTVQADVKSSSLTWKGSNLTFETLTATLPAASEVRNATDYVSGGDFAQGQPQLVLGWAVAQQLSGVNKTVDPLVTAGDAVVVRLQDGQNITATVAGVLKEDKTLFGTRNTMVFVPTDPFYTLTRTSPTTGKTVAVYNGFTVVADSVADVNKVRDEVRRYVDGPSDVAQLKAPAEKVLVATASDIQATISNALGQVTIFIGAIGGVSLVVGAIGIANIMLVSVTERTREIGVMKAIGAKDGEVLVLFLLESILIGLVGAALGIGLGLGGGAAVVNGVFHSRDVKLVIPYDWVGYGLLVGMGVGIVAGFLPAKRATKIQPIQALAYE